MSICKGIVSMAKAYEKETGHQPMFIGVSGPDFDTSSETCSFGTSALASPRS